MRLRKLIFISLLVASFLLISRGPAIAEKKHDTYWANINESGTLGGGGGSGYDGDGNGEGDWYYYSDTGWYNQWFWDDPFDPNRWKEIHIEFDAGEIWVEGQEGGHITVAVNWSTPAWSDLGYGDTTPPIPGVTGFDESLHIQRYTLVDEDFYGEWIPPHIIEDSEPDIYSPWSDHFSFDYVIPDYNPEWVSIDIMGDSFWIGSQGGPLVQGYIDHECVGPSVPEPATMILLGSGLLGLAGVSRKKFFKKA